MVFERIRAMREDRDIKQKQLAEYLCCSQQTYSNYELGTRDIPAEVLIKLADYYSTNVDYIIGLTDNKTHYKKL
ncbi:MAG: helix-turn-helix transcriptional regulator [Ruminiclostridium sp.]|nr:helix-turn-helix transcriptional regulator [Ruminiclostridium sp.]